MWQGRAVPGAKGVKWVRWISNHNERQQAGWAEHTRDHVDGTLADGIWAGCHHVYGVEDIATVEGKEVHIAWMSPCAAESLVVTVKLLEVFTIFKKKGVPNGDHSGRDDQRRQRYPLDRQ